MLAGRALDAKTGARAYRPRNSGGQTKSLSLVAINHLALTVAELERSVPFYDRILSFLGYRLSERQDDYVAWEGPCGWVHPAPGTDGLKAQTA
jgi:hypothetical protein